MPTSEGGSDGVFPLGFSGEPIPPNPRGALKSMWNEKGEPYLEVSVSMVKVGSEPPRTWFDLAFDGGAVILKHKI